MVEEIFNGKTKAKLLENYYITRLCKDTVGEWLINIGFKYDYDINNYYVGDNERRIQFVTYGSLLIAIHY